MTHNSFLFLVASARRNGNSETLARHAATALPATVEQRWLRLADAQLPPFEDIRHPPGDGVYAMPDGEARALLDATLAASDLVFVAPVYWYGLPSSASLYLDHWSGWMRVPGVSFRDRMRGKRMWVLTTISDEDRSIAEPLLGTLRLTADYMGMGWGGAVIGYGNRPGDVEADAAAMVAAASLFRDVS